MIIGFVGAMFWMSGCEQNETYKTTLDNPDTYQGMVKSLTNTVVYDIFSPPVASRVYAYSNIAGYEVLAQSYPGRLKSLGGQLNEFTSPVAPSGNVNPKLASLHAFYLVGKALIFSESMMDEPYHLLLERLKQEGLDESVKKSSFEYGQAVADHVKNWMDDDFYKQTRTFPKYTPQSAEGLWKPTPPDYMEGIEPHWNKIRPMVLDSANQFAPLPPIPFSLDEQSTFYKQLYEVYDVGVNLNDEQLNIAKFWDCNPYVSHHYGHAMFGTKKITPGGHWIGIASIACRQSEVDFINTCEAFTRTSISLFDGFISCWDEKWRSILVRPETLINRHIDEDWKPLLQTPPFPEYTSGHSVISRAAAVTLTDIFGDNFGFNDDTEVEYGLFERQFSSFLEASEEAAISRLYGGIHYRMAVVNGVTQGNKIGEQVVKNLVTAVK